MNIKTGALYLSMLTVLAGAVISSPITHDGSQRETESLEDVCEEEIIDKEKTAILVVDLQDLIDYVLVEEEAYKELFETGYALREATQYYQKKDNIKKVLKYAVDNDIPVVVLEYAGLGSTNQDIKEVLKDTNYKKIIKYQSSGFANQILTDFYLDDGKYKEREVVRNPGLDKHLKELGVDTLIIMGFYKYDCVVRTAIGGKRLGYRIITSPDLLIGGEEGQVPESDFILPSPEEIKKMDEFYRKFVEMHNDTDALLRVIQ